MSCWNGYNENVMSKLMKDIRNLTKKPLEDIEICLDDSIYGGGLSDDSFKSIDAIILGPKDTPFENGKFLVRLEFGNDFPNSPPKGYFLTKIFHPNVKSNNGEICVNTLKRDWKPKYGIKHILIAIRSLLIVPNHDSALNQEAGKLLLESYDEFANRARMYTKIHAMNDTRRQNENDGLTVDDYSSEFDTTNENEEASNKPHSKSKTKSKSRNNNSMMTDSSNSDSNDNSSNNRIEYERKDSNDNSDSNSNNNNNNNNNNNSNNKNQNDSKSSSKSSKSKSNKSKGKSKDKNKKKSKSKGKSKVHLTKSMMRL